ncbi:hypothetical protein [Desulfosudis oleivorans]|uniref:Uncharacterized protein n=1 Tax=Desulfosudis oleivorans (strain DSM 6200 / JCM 39069 / Hxd3) TaxID=96561 RepID=A8ZTN7_DESOH|nr:hypothetical protein [Desulfosudis oleivorans]ABW66301.1 hypothetical protein Dole_0491 [Desulfosudis oleivorans Hxd3]
MKTNWRVFGIALACLVVLVLVSGLPGSAGQNDLAAEDVQEIVAQETGNQGRILSVGDGSVNIDDVEYFFSGNTRFYSATGKTLSPSSFRTGSLVRFLLDTPSTIGVMIKLK